jgi:hypothetical protein
MRLRQAYAIAFPALALVIGSCGGDDNGAGPTGDDAGSGPDTTAGDTGSPDHYTAPVDGNTPRDSASVDTGVDSGVIVGASVLQHHLNATRDGHYVDPLITPTSAGNMHIDATFNGQITGPIWNQPLYVENGPNGKGIFLVASDSNDIYALDETTGLPTWHVNLGNAPTQTAVGCNNCPCGNVSPIGVTGTPVIDLASRTMYLDQGTAPDAGTTLAQHVIHALSIDDGSERSGGWPVNVSLTSPQGVTFSPGNQNQRGALALVNGYLYVPYGGHDGDCGDSSGSNTYHGWVVSIPVANPTAISGYSTPAPSLGGMWATGGVSSDGTDVFVASGNANSNGTYGGGETVFRFHDGTTFTNNTKDFFYPSDWSNLDNGDTDVGASNPIVVDAPAATPSKLIVQFGKNGNVYILDRTNLGGPGTGNGTTGEGLYSNNIAQNNGGAIMDAGATFTSGGNTYVVLFARSPASNCPNGQGGNLLALKIAGNPVTATTVWCQQVTSSEASPIVTTTDTAGSNPIVWITGAEGDNLLHGFDGLSGNVLFPSPDGGGPVQTDQMSQILHFTTLIDVKGRLIVGAQNQLYAFKPQ